MAVGVFVKETRYTMHYAYRSTTDKLNDAFERIEESGHRIVRFQFTGGRDWVLICTDKPAPYIELDENFASWSGVADLPRAAS